MKKSKILLILSVIVISAFFLYALGGIKLPFYWDTGAFLIPASYEMAHTNNILNYSVKMTDYPHTFLLPLTLSIFFKFSNQPIIFIHLFSIFVSTVFLIILLYFSKKEHNKFKYLGLFLVLSFATNPLFLAQTDMVYFEIIGSLFRFLAIFFLGKKNFKYFTVFSLIAFFIRFENGFILPFVGIMDLLFFEKKNKKLLISNIILLLTTISWFVIHYMFTGWWFFSPDRYFDENPIQAIKQSLAYLFLWQGRYIYTLSLIFGLFYSIKYKLNIKRLITKHKFLVLLIINSIPVFAIIGKLGYFLPRYIFPTLLPFYILCFYVIRVVSKKNKYIAILLIFVLPLFQLLSSGNCFSQNFEDCTYIRNVLKTKLESINYINSQYPDSLIYSYFEDNNALTNPVLGYTAKKLNVITNTTIIPDIIYITPTSSGTLYNYAQINNYKIGKVFPINSNNCKVNLFRIPCKTNKNSSIMIYIK